MAPWARRLLAAVLSCTRTMRRLSKACLSIRYLIMRFRPLPCWAWSSQVQPISQAGKAGRNSAKRVVPTSCTPRDGERQRPALALLDEALAVPVRPRRSVHVLQRLAVGFGEAHQLGNVRFHQRLETQGSALQGDR